MKRQTLAQKFMAEKILLGGEVMTRAQAVEMLRADGCCEKCIDVTVFGPRVLVIEEEGQTIWES